MGNTVLEQSKAATPSIDELERKVEAAVNLLVELRGERDRLRSALTEREHEMETLKDEVGSRAEASGEEVEALRRERDDLLRDRNALAQRVEAILERLEGLGLD